MKILLTGGSGFIGRNIKESYLNEKFEIIAPSRAILDCANDESVSAYFKKNSFDVVIHSAAKPGHRNAADTSEIFSTNSRMSLNLLKFHDAWGKMLNMGSGAIYDMEHYVPKMKEEYCGTHIPHDEHGYNKYLLSQIYPRFNVIDFRIFGIFGKHEDYAIRFISNAICKTLFNLPITLRQNRKFDYLFIDDLMPVLDHFVSNDTSFKEYNITPDVSVGLLEIANMVNEVSGGRSQVIVGKEGMGMEYSGDNTRLRSEIPGIQFTTLQRAIESLYQWYKSNISNVNRDFLLVDK